MRTRLDRRVRPLVCLVLCVAGVAGCRQDMHDQPRYEPLQASPFFEDGRSARAPVAGTVARGQARNDAHLYRGRAENASWAKSFPFAIDAVDLDRGQERYEIFCSPCHGLAGDGDGMVARRGFKRPPSLHERRLVEAPPGYVFDVITNGLGAMYPYASRVSVEDRWRIVAYLRALQLSQGAGG